MSSCGNGSCVSRNFTPGKLPGRNTLNGKSTGRVPVTTANGLTTMFLGEKKNRTSKAALLNLSFSRAVLLVLLGFFSWEYRADTNSINPVSRAVWTGKKACIHAGFRRFERHSHSIITEYLSLASIIFINNSLFWIHRLSLVYEFLSLFWVNFWSSFKHSDSVEYSGHPRASVTDLQGHWSGASRTGSNYQSFPAPKSCVPEL